MTLLRDIDAYLKVAGMSDGEFGKRALNDPSFLGQFRQGKLRVGARREARLRKFIGPAITSATGSTGAGHTSCPIVRAPFPPIHAVAGRDPDLASAIEKEAKRRGISIANFLGDLVGRGWASYCQHVQAGAR